MRSRSLLIGLFLAGMLHVDWHLARPTHHRLSFGLEYHWALTALVFGVVGCLIARRWPQDRWRIGAASLLIAVIVAQVIEPLGEAAFYDHRLEYDVEPARWLAFGKALAASIPTFALTLWFCAPRQTDRMHPLNPDTPSA